MGLFDDAFDIDAYVRKRLMEMDDLKNRELFKEVIVDMLTGLYHHAREEYHLLEERVFREVPSPQKTPQVITGMASRQEYDVTDKNLFPMDESDLEPKDVVVEEMLAAVKEQKPFYLFTCLIAEDYLELKKLLAEERVFHGIIENEYGETAADFIIKPNTRYLKKIEELYAVTILNQLPWKTVNCPYLYKLFDVYVTGIETWDEEVQVKKITVEFDEFSDHVKYNVIPLWNARPVNILGNSYPQPALERGYFEHYLYRSQFKEDSEYLLRRSDWALRGVRRLDGDIYILADGETPGDWEFFEFRPAPKKAWYSYPIMANGQNDTFSGNMIASYGMRIKTRTEVVRFLESFPGARHLELADIDIRENPRRRGKETIETYSMEKFIEYEFRSGDWERAMVLSFSPKDPENYLNRDIMSFLTTEIQHYFPEFECLGRLV